MVGLSGSSAIIVAAFKALLRFYSLSLEGDLGIETAASESASEGRQPEGEKVERSSAPPPLPEGPGPSPSASSSEGGGDETGW